MRSNEVNSPYTMNYFNIVLWLFVRYNARPLRAYVIECVFIEACSYKAQGLILLGRI